MANPDKKKHGLGRGLSALLGPEEPDLIAPEADKPTKVVPVAFLKPNPKQPRKRFDDVTIDNLVESIQEKGILQPILVRQHPAEPNLYEIVAGERRWRAAQRAQLHEVPVIVKDLSDSDTLEIALIENIHREDLTPLEEAEGYQSLIDSFNYTQENLSKVIGKSRSHIANMTRLLGLSDEIKSMIDDGLLSAGHGRTLIGVENAEEIALIVIDKGLNVRQTEQLVQTYKSGAPMDKIKKAVAQARDPETMALERSISEQLGMKVVINNKGDAGKITIQYETMEQLDSVITRLNQI